MALDRNARNYILVDNMFQIARRRRSAMDNESLDRLLDMMQDESMSVALGHRDRRTGATLLHWAAWHGNVHFAERLIRGGADVNARDDDGQTPLQWADHRSNEEVMQALQSAGAVPTKQYLTLRVSENADGSFLITAASSIGGDEKGSILCYSSSRIDNICGAIANHVSVDVWDITFTLQTHGEFRQLDALDDGTDLATLLSGVCAPIQQRVDAIDRRPYTKSQFFSYYGREEGSQRWEMSDIYEPEPEVRSETAMDLDD